MANVNIAAIQKTESEARGREVFRMDEFDELVKVGYRSAIKVNSSEDQTSTIPVEAFKKNHRMQKVLKVLDALNEEKQKNALGYR